MCCIKSFFRKILMRKRTQRNKNQSNASNNKKSRFTVKTDATKVKRIGIAGSVSSEKVGQLIDRYKSQIHSTNFEVVGKGTGNQLNISENTRKLNENQRNKIELVANYLKSHINKAIDSSIENRKTEANQSQENALKVENLNRTSNTIYELKCSRTGSKTSEQHIKSVKKSVSVEQAKEFDLKHEKDSEVSSKDKSVHSIIYDESPKYRLETNERSLKNRSMNSVSNIIPISSLNLLTARCGICEILVKHKINITGCSHIFCRDCIHEWLKYSQHCPVCRTLITKFAHSIRIGFNDQICLRSEEDYKIAKVCSKEDNFVDSFGAAFLFEAFCLNYQNLKYLDICIENVSSRVSYLQSILSLNGHFRRDYIIHCRLKDQNQKLKKLREKKLQSEEGLRDISNQVNQDMLAFWRKVVNQKNSFN